MHCSSQRPPLVPIELGCTHADTTNTQSALHALVQQHGAACTLQQLQCTSRQINTPPAQSKSSNRPCWCLPACLQQISGSACDLLPHVHIAFCDQLPASGGETANPCGPIHNIPHLSTTFHTSSKATSLGELALSIATHNTCMPHTCQCVQHTAAYILPPAWASVSLHQVPSQRSQDHTIPARTKAPVTLLQARCTAR